MGGQPKAAIPQSSLCWMDPAWSISSPDHPTLDAHTCLSLVLAIPTCFSTLQHHLTMQKENFKCQFLLSIKLESHVSQQDRDEVSTVMKRTKNRHR